MAKEKIKKKYGNTELIGPENEVNTYLELLESAAKDIKATTNEKLDYVIALLER